MRDEIIPFETIETRIYFIRGKKVMLAHDLAALYKVPTKRLNEQVKRNIDRFPDDFMFQLKREEFNILRCHFVTSKQRSQFATFELAYKKYPPYAFTEQGVAMLSSVLNSKRAIYVNIQIMRAFVRLRKVLATHKELAEKLEQLERKFEKKFEKHDAEIQQIFEVIRQLIAPAEKSDKKIGFTP